MTSKESSSYFSSSPSHRTDQTMVIHIEPPIEPNNLQPSLPDFWAPNLSDPSIPNHHPLHRVNHPHAAPWNSLGASKGMVDWRNESKRNLKRSNSDLTILEDGRYDRMSTRKIARPFERIEQQQQQQQQQCVYLGDSLKSSLQKSLSQVSLFSNLSISSSDSIDIFNGRHKLEDEIDFESCLNSNQFSLEFDPNFGIDPSWLQHLKPILIEPEMISLHSRLISSGKVDQHPQYHYKSIGVKRTWNLQSDIYPPSKDLYSWSRLTPLDQVKVVILGVKPSIAPNQSHGLAFSQPTSCTRLSGAIESIHQELSNQFPDEFVKPEHGSLVSWARSGVLLLNVFQTTQRDDPQRHDGFGWFEFTTKVLEIADRFGGTGILSTASDTQTIIDSKPTQSSSPCSRLSTTHQSLSPSSLSFSSSQSSSSSPPPSPCSPPSSSSSAPLLSSSSSLHLTPSSPPPSSSSPPLEPLTLPPSEPSVPSSLPLHLTPSSPLPPSASPALEPSSLPPSEPSVPSSLPLHLTPSSPPPPSSSPPPLESPPPPSLPSELPPLSSSSSSSSPPGSPMLLDVDDDDKAGDEKSLSISSSHSLENGIVFIAWGQLAIEQIQSAGLFMPNDRRHKILTCRASPYADSAHEDGFFNNQHFRLANEFLAETYGDQHQIDWCKLPALDT